MGRFSKLGEVNAEGGGLYYEGSGSYVSRLGKCLFKANRKHEDCFIIETEVTKSNNPARPVGCKPSVVINFKHDMAPINVKRFVAAMMEIEDPDKYVPEDCANPEDPAVVAKAKEKFWDESTEFIVSDAQPLMGWEVELTTVQSKTKTGNPFTVHQWGKILSRPETKVA